MNKIKNIAIIAHVDHGKTTLVDAILRQTGTFRANQTVRERVMDSNDLERERGITIFSKNASFFYQGYKINIVDTPGHSDFGGEVQRILKMVDSVLLLIDAFEGPMPQTKYVLKKSLELDLEPLVVINKIDRKNSRPHQVLSQVFDLFLELNADDSQLDFPVIYTSAVEGIAKYEPEDESDSLKPLFDDIIKYVPDTGGDSEADFQFLVSAIEYNNYVGKIATGKIHHGRLNNMQPLVLLKKNGKHIDFKATKIYVYKGLKKIEVQEASAGDIVSIAGTEFLDVGDTVADKNNPSALSSIDIDQPTLTVEFTINDSPFAGLDGDYITSRHIWERLRRELQSNVSIEAEKSATPDSFIVKGRGELQLAILIENMRREGYEIQIAKPKVVFREIDGVLSEPVEHVIIDVDQKYAGAVIKKLSQRKGEFVNMQASDGGYTRLEFHIPTRGLLGYRNEFITDTRGSGIMSHSFYEFMPLKKNIPEITKGAIISMKEGEASAYAINNLQARGVFFIEPGERIYKGMIVGEHNRDTDISVNLCKTKKLSNVRASGSDEAFSLKPARKLTIEQGLEYIDDDELMEVTPKHVRFRKKKNKNLN